MHDHFPTSDQVLPSLSVTSSLSRAFTIFSRHAGQFLAIGFVTGVPAFLWFFYIAQTASMGDGMSLVLVLLVVQLCSALCFAMVIFGTFQTLRERPVSAIASLKHGLTSWASTLAVSLLVVIIVVGGLLLLLVPGLIAGTILAVAVPASVVESRTPIDSLRRSASLTRGYRWGIFGATVALGLVDKAVQYVIDSAFLHGYSFAPYAWAGATSLLVLVFTTYQAVFLAVLYHDMRVAKEGVDINQIAAVFD